MTRNDVEEQLGGKEPEQAELDEFNKSWSISRGLGETNYRDRAYATFLAGVKVGQAASSRRLIGEKAILEWSEARQLAIKCCEANDGTAPEALTRLGKAEASLASVSIAILKAQK